MFMLAEDSFDEKPRARRPICVACIASIFVHKMPGNVESSIALSG